MSRCNFKITESALITELVLTGSIDETFSTESLKFDLTKPLVINVKDVKLISSSGTRAWIKFMDQLNQATITFIQCSKVFIDQVNTTYGFCPRNANVLSFYTPYFNKKMNSEMSVLYTFGKEFKSNEVTPIKEVKDDSGNVHILDVNEKKYFKFIKHAN